jgi:hypothetical protein
MYEYILARMRLAKKGGRFRARKHKKKSAEFTSLGFSLPIGTTANSSSILVRRPVIMSFGVRKEQIMQGVTKRCRLSLV